MSDELHVICKFCGDHEGLGTVEQATTWHTAEGFEISDGILDVVWTGASSPDGDYETIGYVCQTCNAQTDELEELVVIVKDHPITIERWVVNVSYTDAPHDWPRANEKEARALAARAMETGAWQTQIRKETVTVEPRDTVAGCES